MSAADEDLELQDLMAQTLEKNGALAKIRAELRASIFLALDEDVKLSQTEPLQNLRLQSYLKTPEGRMMFGVVREFLEFFNLDFTISVFEPESYMDNICPYKGRKHVAKDLGLQDDDESTVPLLQCVVKLAQAKTNILDINLNLSQNTNGSFKDESYKKTETLNTPSDLDKKGKLLDPNALNLNQTFDLNSPIMNISALKKATETNILSKTFQVEEENENVQKSNSNLVSVPEAEDIEIVKKINKEDDTYEDTSSIAEDSEAKESKLSPQRSKTNLNNLSDLPPLQSNKTRVNADILPSLYNKEFKSKPKNREFDKTFDTSAEYEEDFMYSGESSEPTTYSSRNGKSEGSSEANSIKTKNSV